MRDSMRWSQRRHGRVLAWVMLLAVFGQSTLTPVAARTPAVASVPHPRVTQPLGPAIARRSVMPPTPNIRPASTPAHAELQPTDTRGNPAPPPLPFVPNRGQTDPTVQFQVRTNGQSIFFRATDIIFTLPAPISTTLQTTPPVPQAAGAVTLPGPRNDRPAAPLYTAQLQFLGANPASTITPVDQQPGVVHSFLGKDSRAWATRLPTYAGLTYPQLYDQITLQYASHNGDLKSTFTIAPGGDPGKIRWQYPGAERVSVQRSGELAITLALRHPGLERAPRATLIEDAPLAWQTIGERTIPVDVRYTIGADQVIRFAVGAYDRTQPLVIDPTVRFSTYLGTGDYDQLHGVAVDRTGATYVTGTTAGSPFPQLGSGAPAPYGSSDVVVVKLDSTGQIPIFTAYVGGSGGDIGRDIAIDDVGQVYVAGHTFSTDFPEVDAQQSGAGGDIDAFVFKLSVDGDALLHSTPLGGSEDDLVFDLAVANDSDDSVYLTGYTNSADFPTTSGAYDVTCNSCSTSSDAFVTKLATTNATSGYSTFVGGNNFAQGHSIVAESSGVVHVAGQTGATNFPVTTGAYQTSYQGGFSDSFILTLNASGTARTFGTYLGGSGADCEVLEFERECALARDSSGNFYLAGSSSSTNFPVTSGVYDTTANGDIDFTVSKLNAAGSSLLFSTYLGGSALDATRGIALAPSGDLVIVGETRGSGFPQVDAIQGSYGGQWDALVVVMSNDGTTVRSSSYLGGSHDEQARDVAVTNRGWIAVTGWTRSTNFPTQTAIQPTYGGNDFDGFLTILGEPVILPLDQQRCGCSATQPSAGVGVNTRSGNFSTTIVDLAVQTPGPPVFWQRTYASQSVAEITGTLGFGWQHPYAARLILPSMPGGEVGQITVLTPENNRSRFIELLTGDYLPYPGITDTFAHVSSTFVQTLRDQRQYIFDDTSGLLLSMRDAQGNTLNLTYSGSPSQLTHIEDAGDGTRSLDLTYSANRIATVSDGVRTVAYGYDGNGDLQTVTDIASRVTTYTYDQHLLTDIENAISQTVLHVDYDGTSPTSKVTDQTLLGGQTIAFAYTTTDTTVTTTGTDSQTMVQAFGYRADNTVTTIMVNGEPVAAALFDDSFSPGLVVDGNEHQTRTVYTDNGLPLQQIDALGNRTQMTYDNANRLLSTTDAQGIMSRFRYDALGNVISTTVGISTTNLISQTTLYDYLYDLRYSGDSLIQTVTRPDGVMTRYEYDGRGQVTTLIAGYSTALEQRTGYAYDAAGRVVTTTLGVGTAFERNDITNYNADNTVAETIQRYDDGVFDPAYPDQDVVTTYGYDGLGRQIWVQNVFGQYDVTRYNALGQVEASARHVSALSLDGDGQPIIPAFDPAIPDQDVTTQYGYDGLGRTILVTETGILSGTLNTSTLTYSAATSRVTRTEYDSQSRPVTVTLNYRPGLPATADTNLQTLTYYDGAGNVIWQRDALGRWTKTEYDARNRPVKVIRNYDNGDPTTSPFDVDVTSVTTYDALGRVATQIDSYVDGGFDTWVLDEDRTTAFTYDQLGRTTTVTRTLDLPSLGSRTDTNLATHSAYDLLTGRMLGQQDTLGRWTSQQYDALGRVTTTIQNCRDSGGDPVATGCDSFAADVPDRNVPAVTHYDAIGRVESTENALGIATRSVFDGLGRTVTTIQNYDDGTFDAGVPDTDVTTASIYDGLGRVVTSLDAAANASALEYDGLGRTIVMTDTMTRVTRTGYDGTGATRWTQQPDGMLTVYDLDGFGRVITTTTNYDDGVVGGAEPDDQDLITVTHYDAAGRTEQTIDAAGQVTQFAYDNLDRLIAVTENAVTGACVVEPCNVVTSYTYDRVGNRTAITDANSHTRSAVFDAADRQTIARDALNQETQWEYDQGSRITLQRDPRGSDFDLSYSYDELDRPTELSAIALTAPITTTYDTLGRRTHLGDATGVTSFAYDALNRVTGVTAPATGIGYGYDARGLRTRLTYPDSSAIDYTYYNDGQLAGVWQDSALLAGYSYTPIGQVYQVTRAITATTTYGYDGAGRLTDLATANASDTLSAFTYTLDRRGLRTAAGESWQDPAGLPHGTGTGLEGEYYNDPSLTTLVLTRTDSLVDFNWNLGAPDGSLPDDGFSVRWRGTIQPRATGIYTFTTTADDGVRLWINGELIIDDWNPHAPEEHAGTTSTALVAGQYYDITLEYFEDLLTAEVQLEWASAAQPREIIPTSQLYPPVPPATGTGTGLFGAYYSDMSLSTLVLTRTDSLIDFDWGLTAPDGSLPDDGFGVRWTGTIQPRYTEPYTFITTADDGVRLWVNGELIIDDWNPHTVEEHEGTTTLPLVAGRQYTITLEYFEDLLTAEVQLEWASIHQAREIVPTSQLYLPGEGSGTGLFGAYYSDTTLSTQVFTRTDSLIDFNWDVGSPDASVPDDGFSVRWSGMVQPRYTEPYTFTTTADDGVRLWVNDELIIDDWTTHISADIHQGVTSAALTAGQPYTITLEYFEDTDTAVVQLEWESSQQVGEIVPTSQLYPHVPTNLVLSAPLTNTRVLTYTYDGLQRLTDVQEVGPTATTAYSYTYDLAGNRLEAWTDSILVQNRIYDDANQVIGWAYDAAGNLLDDGTTINTWDALNRLTVQGTTNNTYNGDGVLVAQTTGSGTINYTQDLISPLSQILGDGTSQYIYGSERLYGVAGSTRTWYLGDALGSVRQTFDDAGLVQQTQRYDAWGAPQGTAIAPFGYTGELQQGNQVYLRARWYNAGNGAFGSRDSFAGFPEQPYSLNQYQYSYANPVLWTDPSGEFVTSGSDGGGQDIARAACRARGGVWDVNLRTCREQVAPPLPNNHIPSVRSLYARDQRTDGDGNYSRFVPPQPDRDHGDGIIGPSIDDFGDFGSLGRVGPSGSGKAGIIGLLALCALSSLAQGIGPAIPSQGLPPGDGRSGKHYVQSDGITIKIGFDHLNASKQVKLGYDDYLGGTVPDGYSIRTGWFWPGLASKEDNDSGWWPALMDALANTNTINFVVEGMDVYNNPESLKADRKTHEEMDEVIKRGYISKLHLWRLRPRSEELTGQERLSWIDKWIQIRALP